MRVWIISDLHTEFRPYRPPHPLPDADVCVVAGDAGTKGPARSIELLKPLARELPVIMVAGNHEHYGASVVEGLAEAREAAVDAGVHFLENDLVVIGGVTFVGATLWTDLALHSRQATSMYEVGQSMNDYKKIKLSKKPFRRMSTYASVRMHLESRGFLERTLARRTGGRVVVVTHHAPSARSLPQTFLEDDAAPAYASALDDMIIEHQPDIWFHGHVHASCDYFIGSTRIVSNPRGYPGEETGFQPDLVVEVQ